MVKKTLKLMAGVLIFGLALVGCGNKTTQEDPVALEKQATMSIAQAKYIDADIDFTLAGNINGENQQVTITGTLQEDATGDFPIFSLNGQVTMNNLPNATAIAYIGPAGMYTNLAGTVKQAPLTEQMKQSLQNYKQEAVASVTDMASSTDIQKVVTMSEENNQKLVNVVVDPDSINDYLQNQLVKSILDTELISPGEDLKFEALEVVYVLNSNNEVQEIRYDLTIATGTEGKGLNLKGTVTIKSLNQQLTIQMPEGMTTQATAAGTTTTSGQ